MEDTLECDEKGNELMNQSLIEKICQKLIPFHSPIKKNKFTSFRDAVEQTEDSSCGKTKSAKVNRYVLRALTLFSIQSEKVIYYEKALTSALSPIPLNIANADGSWGKQTRVNWKI